MREVRLTVGDYASQGRGDVANPCVMGCAHLFLGSLFVLGEGNGGSEGGRVESRLAVSAVLANFRSSQVTDPTQRLNEALTHAGEVLYSRARSASAFKESWAGCVAVLYRRGRLYAARTGNLRLLLVRNGEVRDLFDAAAIAEKPPVLGQADRPFVQMLEEELDMLPGDRMILANSGLIDTVGLPEVSRFASTLVPAVAARRIVEACAQKSGESPVSIQVVQIGDAPTVVEEASRKHSAARKREPAISAAPVAPVRMAASTTSPASIPRLDEPDEPFTRNWTPILMALVAVGLVGYLLKTMISGPADEPKSYADRTSDAAESDSPSSDSAAGTQSDVFWGRVATRLGPDGKVLDPQEVKRWLKDDGEAERRRREARAVLAALPELPEDQPDVVAEVGEQPPTPAGVEPGEPIPEPGQPTEAAEDPTEPDEPGPEVVVIPEDQPADPGGPAQATPQPEPSAWDPDKLPPRLRRYENIFASKDPATGAKRLKTYVHARAARADMVFAQLDLFLKQAPPERSLAVLIRLKEGKAGPKTLRWARPHIARLRAELQP